MSKPKKLELDRTDVTLENLQDLEKQEPQNTENPKSLRLSEIYIADQVFQPRQTEYNLSATVDHIKGLANDLKSQKTPFDPLVVVPIGSKFFVIDGHHRIAAYRTAGWSESVPVEVNRVSLEQARRQSLSYNNKNKLPMTLTDKQESAWKLVKEGVSKAKIHKATRVSTSNIANMKRVLRKLKSPALNVGDMTWRQALKSDRGLTVDFDRESWVDEKAMALRDKLMSASGTKFVDNPEVLAKAIRMISDRLPMALIEEWHEEAYDYVEEHREAIEEERRIDKELDL